MKTKKKVDITRDVNRLKMYLSVMVKAENAYLDAKADAICVLDGSAGKIDGMHILDLVHTIPPVNIDYLIAAMQESSLEFKLKLELAVVATKNIAKKTKQWDKDIKKILISNSDMLQAYDYFVVPYMQNVEG